MHRESGTSRGGCKVIAVILLIFPLLMGGVLTRSAEGSYSGILSSADGGIIGSGIWVDPLLLKPSERPQWAPVTLQWTISQNPDQSWHYDYLISVYKKDVSHFSIEVSPDFERHDIFNDEGPYEVLDLGWHVPGGSNPLIPEAMYGIKFDSTTGTTVNIWFDSWRVPVWGDFYTKDGVSGGVLNEAWNAGFTVDDVDPSAPPADGSLNYHILVPDTETSQEVVPEPSAVIFFATGLAGVFFMARKRLSAKQVRA